MTPNIGTGTYTEYVYRVKCSGTGTFSSGMYFYFVGPDVEFYVDVAYATVFDTMANDRTTYIDSNGVYTGTLVAQQITATNVVFGTANIGDGTITNAKIANLDAGKINTGFLNAARIEALSITADKIAGGTITADKLNAANVQAALVTAKAIESLDITTGRLTVKDGARIGGMVIENNMLKGGSIVLTDGAKIGGFTVNGNSLTSSDSTGKVMIGDNMIRFLRINEDASASMLAIRNDNGSVLSLYSHGVTGRCLGIQAQSSAIAIESTGSHLFKQRAGEVWNAPGVLWCGQYSCSNWNPALVRSWGNGLNVTGISRQRAGCYTITHNLGHVDYFVHAIGNAQIRDNWNWWNTTVSFFGHSANQFSLLFKDDGGSEKDPAEFQVMIFGRNKF